MVADSRKNEYNECRRRYYCKKCKQRFSTIETCVMLQPGRKPRQRSFSF